MTARTPATTPFARRHDRPWCGGSPIRRSEHQPGHSRRRGSAGSPLSSPSFGRLRCALQRATMRPLPDLMSAKFALQWRHDGCAACMEVCYDVCSAIRYGLARRDAHGRPGNGCMRPAAAISQADRPPQSLSPCRGLADLAPEHEWRPLGRSHPRACPQRRQHLDFPSLFQHRAARQRHLHRSRRGQPADLAVRSLRQAAQGFRRRHVRLSARLYRGPGRQSVGQRCQ